METPSLSALADPLVEQREPDSSLLAEALRYQEELGWALLPIGSDKRPHFDLLPRDRRGKPTWKPLAENPASPDDIRHWFEIDPHCNIGLLTGDPSGGVAVLDFDGPDPAGFRTPPTPMVETARGRHVYFSCPSGTKGRTFPWGELRANGGYVVLPPSLHPSGRRYEWECYLSPYDVDLLNLPSDVLPAEPKVRRGSSGRERQPSARAKKSEAAPAASAVSRSLVQVNDIVYLHNLSKGVQAAARREATPNGTCAGSDLSQWVRREEVVADLAAYLGMPAGAMNGNSFRCILPGHDEIKPSASLFYDPKYEVYVYRDWHAVEGIEWYTLGEVRAAFAYGTTKRLGKPEMAVWLIRLLVERGYLYPDVLNWIWDLPEGTPQSVRRTWQGFALLRGCRWLHTPYAGTPFSHRFAEAWCGLSQPTVGAAIRGLIRRGYLEIVDRYGKLTLFDIGLGDGSGDPVQPLPKKDRPEPDSLTQVA